MEALLADEENQSRRTFCQMSFGSIYDTAERGQTSMGNLVNLYERQAEAQRKYASSMLEAMTDVFKPVVASGLGELHEFEEPGTSLKRSLTQLQQYLLALHTQKLVWAQILDEHIKEPLKSLQTASSSYIKTLENEIIRVNDEYAVVEAMQKKINATYDEAQKNLQEAQRRQLRALHEIGVPSFELQRLAARIAKCQQDLREAAKEKNATKKLLLAKIVARDEMAMAVSVAYQRTEEERMDQIASSLKMIVSVERDQIKFREKQLEKMEELVDRLDRSGDLQLLIHNRQSPNHMHFQGKALSILDWHWKHEAANPNADDEVDLLDDPKVDENESSTAVETAATFDSIQKGLASHFTVNLFSDDEDTQFHIPEDFTQSIAEWCATSEGRSGFVQMLNRQRSLDTKLKDENAFQCLVQCFDTFFDACAQHEDIRAAKTAMMLAATFFHSPDQIQDTSDHRVVRKYIQEDVKHHDLWRNPKFWEKALLLAVGEELHKAPQKIPWEDLPSNLPRSEGVFTREEAVSLVHNIVFGQLGSFTLSMVEFDVPLEEIRHFIETMCDAHELTEDQRFVLRANLRDIALKFTHL
ncbi:hypothetical protein THRCLA_06569 [Thraustotheca clavata]|uniref:SBF1/SBF2 domain-containing protein n=1 Tax=Thraustotheca clavata TaxID=74557 RepID=A0A1V9ZN97_9STRA|nr:hypothetical protein THRCLA_06569 [Thraustotheca clavata]